MNKTYSELIQLSTFEERFEYLRLNGIVGNDTFGSDRIFNQYFYKSKEWASIRNHVIVRDDGCDLGIKEREIYGQKIIIHHIVPISLDDIMTHSPFLFDPENLITTTHTTHNAIHYGSIDLLELAPIDRSPFDTCPWRL